MRLASDTIIAVIGPTASGKTSLAVDIAKKFHGELINADSRQIYRKLDLGTAKGPVEKVQESKSRTSAKWQIHDVPIHLINIVEPDGVLTLAEYQKLAYESIKDVFKHGKIPILVGGTGLYIDAIFQGYSIPQVEPDLKLRNELEQKTVKELQNDLKKSFGERFEAMNRSDRNNPRRLIRAIEVAKHMAEKRIPQKDIQSYDAVRKNWKIICISPKYTRAELYDQINRRVYEMLDAGLLDEVRGLLEQGYSFDTPSFTAIAYPLAQQYLRGKLSKEEFVLKWQQKERNYARRQITWFKRYEGTIFVDGVEDLEM